MQSIKFGSRLPSFYLFLLLSLFLVFVFHTSYADLVIEHSNDEPTRVAMGQDGKIYVSDPAVGSIFIYESSMTLSGEMKGMDKPLGLAVDAAGNVYVGNDGRDNVEVYDSSGSNTLTIDDGNIQMPNDIALDSSGNVYVVDSLSNVVKVYDSSGSWLRNIGTGALNFPVAVTFNQAESEIFVANQGDYNIKVFTPAGTPLRTIGDKILSFSTVWEGLYTKIQSLDIDDQGLLHVCDSYTNMIQIVNPITGECLASYGSFGTDLGELNLPLDISIRAAGETVVSINENKRVEVIPYNVVASVPNWMVFE